MIKMVLHTYMKKIIPCDAKRKKMRSSGQLFRACWPAEHTATSLSGITSLGLALLVVCK